MKTRLIHAVRAVALTLVFAGSAFGALIQGNITFAGGARLDTDSVTTATGVVFWRDPVVASRDGDFAPYVSPGDVVDLMEPWTFDSVGPVLNFWSVGGFSFDLMSSAITFQDGGAVSVKGTGMTSGNGFDATPGSWSFTSQDPAANGIFSFSAGSAHTNSVPDSGTTAAFMGAVLLGLGFVARRRTV